MKIKYDNSVDAAFIDFACVYTGISHSSIKIPVDVFGNIAVIDLDKEGRMVRLEILGASHRLPEKVLQSKDLIKDGTAVLNYDEESNTAHIILSDAMIERRYECYRGLITIELGAKSTLASLLIKAPMEILPASLMASMISQSATRPTTC